MKAASLLLQIGIQLVSYAVIARTFYKIGLSRGYRCWLRSCRNEPEIVKALRTLDRTVPGSSKLVDATHQLIDSTEVVAGLKQQLKQPVSRFSRN